MLSYQHAYHAGNFADVHKHLALILLLQSLQKKATPFCYIDTHAGRGLYDLGSAEARKTAEYQTGIGRLLSLKKPPAALADYRARVRAFNKGSEGDALHCYPGSPALAQTFLREQDQAILLELHPREVPKLREQFRADKRIAIHARDCYEGLPALVPPKAKRGLVLLDPSYEVKDEYRRVTDLLLNAHARWTTGIYALWYPLLPEARHKTLLNKLEKSKVTPILCSELRLRFPAEGSGMYGSGIIIVNPPWKFDTVFAETMNSVAQALAEKNGGANLFWLTGNKSG